MANRTAALVRMPTPRAVSAPIIRVSAPRAKPKKHHRRRGGGGGSKKDLTQIAIAAAVIGYIDRGTFPIPTIPMLGRAGTIAAGIYFFGPKTGIWRDALIAATSIAGYELGNKGSISGDVMGDVARQVGVGRVASQV